MKPVNRMRVVFPSRSANESFARLCVAGFFAQLDPTVDELGEIKTIVSEAVTNCIVHAYRDTIGLITLTASYSDDGEIRLTIADKGVGMRDPEAARLPLYTTVQDGTRAGSLLTMENALKNLMAFTGQPLEACLPCVTEAPARLLGVFSRRGSIDVGKYADLVVLSDDLQVLATLSEGILIYQA